VPLNEGFLLGEMFVPLMLKEKETSVDSNLKTKMCINSEKH
jgi:hypothetical protein